MTLIDNGTYGAYVQSWRRANPRDILRRVIEENPGAGKDILFKDFRDQVRSDDNAEFLESIIEYWFSNNYHSLIESPAAKKSERQTQTQAATRRALVEKVKEKIQSRLLDMPLPNGKALRDSTFGYCRKLGGGLSRIGAKGKPDEVVGKHLSETEVRKLYGRAAI